jgi:hypothetical protein
MPLSYHPRIRALQEAQELAGVIKPANSVAVANLLSAEAQGQKKKTVPVVVFSFSGGKAVRYTAA